jgi:hypothetical protein
LGVYSRPTVPRPVYTGDSHSCERPIAVPERPNRPRSLKKFLRFVSCRFWFSCFCMCSHYVMARQTASVDARACPLTACLCSGEHLVRRMGFFIFVLTMYRGHKPCYLVTGAKECRGNVCRFAESTPGRTSDDHLLGKPRGRQPKVTKDTKEYQSVEGLVLNRRCDAVAQG